MDEIRSLLKTIRGVGPNKPVTQLQLSEIIRALHRERMNLYDEYYTGGVKPIATGKNSVAIGEGTLSTSYREMLVGSFPEELTATSDEWVSTDRLFGIGNGINADNRHDAFRVYKSGYAQLNNGLRLGAYSWGANNPEAGALQYTAGGSISVYRNTTWNRLAFIDSFATNNQFAYFDSLTETLKTRAIAIADITGLQTALDGKSPVHTHPYLSDSDSRISQWEAAYTARISSLTNVGNSGQATLIGNVLNIPNYTLAGLGGAPVSGSDNYIQNGTGQQTGNFNISGIGKANEFLIGNRNISSGVFSIERTLSGLNKHGFDDYTSLNITSDQGVAGYSSFDAYPILNNSISANHLNGYQSRINYNGSGNLSVSYGYYAALSHGGTGTLDFYRGIGIAAPVKTSSGGINYQQGLYIGDFSTGSLVNEAIHIDGGSIYGGSDLSLNGNAPEFILNSINQGTDSKKWDFFAYDKLKFRLLNDANTVATDIFEVRRIAMSLDGFYLNTSFNAPSATIIANSGTYVPLKNFGNLNIGNLWYGSILVGRSENTNQSAQFGWVYDQANPSNSFAHITPYGSREGSVYKFDAVGNATMASSVNTLAYKLSGVDLFSSLSAGSRTKWDGAKLVNDTDAFLPLTGGTLTGNLTGTTANFSGAATAASFVFGTTGWSIEVVADKFTIKRNGVALKTLDASGNNKVLGDSYRGGL